MATYWLQSLNELIVIRKCSYNVNFSQTFSIPVFPSG